MSTCASLLRSIRINYYFSILSISHITFVIVTIQSTSCTSYIHEMHVVFVSFFPIQRITQKSIIFHPREFSYAFNVISTNIPFIRAFLIKKYIICLFFSKLDLSAYLYYYMLSLAFYFKNYCIFLL